MFLWSVPMPVMIRKQPAPDGTWYEIDDFGAYLDELSKRGIESPNAKYRVFISSETARDIATINADFESQIALFFRLGPASGIDYEITGTKVVTPL
jgi:hypothetical protein